MADYFFAGGQLLIAAIVAVVAWQSYKLNEGGQLVQKDKLRLDLFDRRLKVFESCQKLFLHVLTESNLSYTELREFALNSSNSQFIFREEVDLYIKKVQENGLKIIQLNRRLTMQKLTDNQRATAAYDLEKLESWFLDQIKDSKKLFKPYLHFDIERNGVTKNLISKISELL